MSPSWSGTPGRRSAASASSSRSRSRPSDVEPAPQLREVVARSAGDVEQCLRSGVPLGDERAYPLRFARVVLERVQPVVQAVDDGIRRQGAPPVESPPVSATAATSFQNYVGGEWVDAASGETFETSQPGDRRDARRLPELGRRGRRPRRAGRPEAFESWRLVPRPSARTCSTGSPRCSPRRRRRSRS